MIGLSGRGQELLFVPLGGAGEIGMNMNLYGYGGAWIMVDFGITFADDTMPGIDVIMPDPSFIVERRDELLGLVLTHAHEDHLGAVPYLWREICCPIYGTRFTLEILKIKLEEAGLLDEVPLIEVPESGKIRLGPFDVTYLPVTHSIPESNAISIETPLGTVLHTGDFKIDPKPVLGPMTDRDSLMELGNKGVLAMVGDSTNIFEQGTSGSESEVRESLENIIGQIDTRVAVATFASHIARICTLAAIAEVHDRHTALIGRSLWRNISAARAAGYLKGAQPFLTPTDAAHLPRDKVLLICTGSQGETRGAMARIASCDHPHVVLETGDVAIFSAKVIPGNELAHYQMHNRLVQSGVRVITEGDQLVHVSGHPGRDELADMYRWVRPRIAIPVHGERRHLAEHAAFAKMLQVPETVTAENGSVIRLAPGDARIVETVPTGRLVLEGTRIESIDSEVIQLRRRLAQNGIVFVMVVVSSTGHLMAPPSIILRGAHDLTIINELEHAVLAVIRDIEPVASLDNTDVSDAVERAVRRVLKREGGKRALVETKIICVDESISPKLEKSEVCNDRAP